MLIIISDIMLAQSNNHIPTPLNGKIISTENINYPMYSDIKGIKNYYDSITYTTAIKDKAVKTEKLTYISDGLKVVAYLSTPSILKNKKYPIIIFNRGSLVRNDIPYVHRALFTKLVKAGYIVLAPSLRESEGSEGKDEFGGKEVNDILNTLPLLSSLAYSDTSKIYMIGESRGGIMTYLSLKEGFPAKAVVTIGAITDLNLYIQENPELDNVAKQFIPGYIENKTQLLKDRSVLNWADMLHCPILILHGQNDKQVPPKNATSLALNLGELEKEYQLVILKGGNHMLSNKYSDERDRQIIEWFKIYK